MLLCVAMLVAVALPVFGAYDLANINKYSVFVTDEKITVDGNPDDVYYKSTKIQSILTEDRYYRPEDDNGVPLPDEVKAAEFVACFRRICIAGMYDVHKAAELRLLGVESDGVDE